MFHGTNGADQLSPDKLNSSLMLGAAKTAIEKNGIAYIAGKNNDNITASTTNDYLDGGTGDDNLKGGFGTDTYVFKAGDGKDTIVDTDGNGQITVAGNALSGAALSDYKLLPGGQGQLSVNNGATVYTLDASHKQLVITGSSLGADSKITVNNFDIGRSGGYLGIKLETSPKAFIKSGLGPNPFQDYDFDETTVAGSSNLNEGNGKSFTVYLNAAAKANDTVTLALAGELASQFKAVLGDITVAAQGAVITLAEGQTQVSFALVQEGEVTADTASALSVTYNGGSQSATSNSWGITLKDAGTADLTINGDMVAAAVTHQGSPIRRVNQAGQLVTVVDSLGPARCRLSRWWRGR